MGQGGSSSRSVSSSSMERSSSPHNHSHRARLRQKLRRIRRRCSFTSKHSTSSTAFKLVSTDDFAGIALLSLISAEMKFKDRWMACVSLGEQTFRTDISDQTEKPVWNSEKKLLLESNGPHVARVSVYESNILKKNSLIGYCEIDLLQFLTQDSDSEAVDLLDPSSPYDIVGKLFFSCFVEDPQETEKSFARRILSIVGYNEDGLLSFSEFSDLIDAFGNEVATHKKEELFQAADANGDGVVSMDELAALLALQQEKEPLINSCPVCGEILDGSNMLPSIIHMTLCFNEGTGNSVMSGGFLTEKQASLGWLFKLSEWAHFSSYGVGLNKGSKAAHILVFVNVYFAWSTKSSQVQVSLDSSYAEFAMSTVIVIKVFDRSTKRLVEELISGKIILSTRAIYQSKLGLHLMYKGATELLQDISEKQGRKMNSVESVKDIPKFISFFKDQINLSEMKYPLDHFKTLNEFFIRELKPGARPIACMDRDDVAVCAADCRLMAFRTVTESTRFWVKGRKFSVQGLLGNDVSATPFIDGAVVILRLAPQDYHRFHFPVSGIIERVVRITGSLYTVNPIAVNSKYGNVFTENKRVVSIISTACFGKVAFIAIGATMVGSITFTRNKGDHVKKGDQLFTVQFGYFSCGGSTVICVFEKDVIKIDADLLENSTRSLETLVRVGMQLGVSAKTCNYECSY